MSLTIPWLIFASIATIAAMVHGVQSRNAGLTANAACAFSLLLVVVACVFNMGQWRGTRAEDLAVPRAPGDASRDNAQLMALTYAWGGASLLAIYSFSTLEWQHGWQYGAGMLAIAAGLLVYSLAIDDDKSRLRTRASLSRVRWLAYGQAGAALAGLVYLVIAGKFFSTRSDWAANLVFFWGGLAIVVESLLGAETQRRFLGARDHTGTAP